MKIRNVLIVSVLGIILFWGASEVRQQPAKILNTAYAAAGLSIEYTKQWPSLAPNGILTVPVQVVIKEDDVDVRTFTVTLETSKANADVSTSSSILIAKVQAEVDRYLSEKAVYNHQKFDDLVTAIQNGVTLE